MDIFPLLSILSSMAKYSFPFFFLFIICCKLFDSKSESLLLRMQALSNKATFIRVFFLIGCITGILWGFMIVPVQSVINAVFIILAGIISGFIIFGIAYAIIHTLADYLAKTKDD